MILYLKMLKELKILNEKIRVIVSKPKSAKGDKATLSKLKHERTNVLSYIVRKRTEQLRLNGDGKK